MDTLKRYTENQFSNFENIIKMIKEYIEDLKNIVQKLIKYFFKHLLKIIM